MGFEAVKCVFAHSRATPLARLVLVCIATHQGENGAWPSVPTLARETGGTERGVYLALKQLEQLGELQIQRKSGSSNHYSVLPATPERYSGVGAGQNSHTIRQAFAPEASSGVGAGARVPLKSVQGTPEVSSGVPLKSVQGTPEHSSPESQLAGLLAGCVAAPRGGLGGARENPGVVENSVPRMAQPHGETQHKTPSKKPPARMEDSDHASAELASAIYGEGLRRTFADLVISQCARAGVKPSADAGQIRDCLKLPEVTRELIHCGSLNLLEKRGSNELRGVTLDGLEAAAWKRFQPDLQELDRLRNGRLQEAVIAKVRLCVARAALEERQDFIASGAVYDQRTARAGRRALRMAQWRG